MFYLHPGVTRIGASSGVADRSMGLANALMGERTGNREITLGARSASIALGGAPLVRNRWRVSLPLNRRDMLSMARADVVATLRASVSSYLSG